MAGNLRIAKNALLLYTRSIITTIVGIFTARIILEALGVEDYGVLNVAGGLLGMFAFVTDGLGTATSRYITYELGRDDKKRLNDTFCTSMIIFMGLALIVVILGETVGLWILRNKLVIPEGREAAAEWVFHLSIIGAAISIPQAPYDACLIAHEKFNVTAYLSLFSTFARLGCLYLVAASEYDHLILYSILIFLLNISILAYRHFYCLRHFPESKMHFIFDRRLLDPMMKFSFWEIFGSISRILNGVGFTIIINMFFGVLLNAAIGIGATVSGAVTGLAFTVISAFKPGMVKHFARNDFRQFKESLMNSSMISMILYGVFSIPLIVELNYVMRLWLKEVPEYSTEICLIQLVSSLLFTATFVTAESLKSMGHNKGINILNCCNSIFTISLVLFSLSSGASPVIVYGIFSLNIIWCFIGTCWLMKKRIGMKYISLFISHSVTRILLTEICVYIILQCVHIILGESFLTLIINCVLSVILFAIISFRFLLSQSQQGKLRLLLKSRVSIFEAIRTTT